MFDALVHRIARDRDRTRPFPYGDDVPLFTVDWRGADVCRRCQVDHAPWPQQRIELHVLEQGLLGPGGVWWARARFIGANYSSGVSDVVIGAPRQIAHARG